MICKGCNEDKPPVRSHIIPESFFRELRADEKTLKLVPTDKEKHVKRAPIGVYDQEILCAECERTFQDVDDYACKVLVANQQLIELQDKGEVVGYRIKDIDYSMLKRFVISVLWRASISSAEFFQKVRLGALESKAKDLIWRKSAGSKHDFSFVLGKFTDTGTLSKAIFDPHPERWFGKKYYRFYMGGYVLYVKADSQATPEMWTKFIPDGSDLLIISRGKIDGSKEFSIFLQRIRT